jgi:hypothetical protein
MTMWQGKAFENDGLPWQLVIHEYFLQSLTNKFISKGGMGHGTGQGNPWMKLMGIVSHKDRRHDAQPIQGGSNERTLNM